MADEQIVIRFMRPEEYVYPHQWILAQAWSIFCSEEHTRMWVTAIPQITSLVAVDPKGFLHTNQIPIFNQSIK